MLLALLALLPLAPHTTGAQEPVATQTPTPAPTATEVPAPTATPAPDFTLAAEPTATVEPTATSAIAPTATPAPTVAPTAAATPTVAPTATSAPTAAPTAAATPTAAPTPTPTAPSEFQIAGGEGGGFAAAGATSYTASVADLTLPAVSYAHTAQTSTGTMTLTAEDNQATPGQGWHVTIQVSAFGYSGVNGGTSIPAANFSLTSAGTPTVVSGQAVDPTNGPKVPASLSLPVALGSPQTVIQANAGYGQGTYTQALGVALTIPAMSRAGTYTGTLTVTISAGP